MPVTVTPFIFPFSSLFYFTYRRVSGVQQLNEWTDILAHLELHAPSSSVNNSFETKQTKTDELKPDIDMAKVHVNILNFLIKS